MYEARNDEKRERKFPSNVQEEEERRGTLYSMVFQIVINSSSAREGESNVSFMERIKRKSLHPWNEKRVK